jgi:hypothetical protein
MEDMKSVMEWPEEATKETLLPAEIDGEGAWVKEGGWAPDTTFQVGDLCHGGGVLGGESGVGLLEVFLNDSAKSSVSDSPDMTIVIFVSEAGGRRWEYPPSLQPCGRGTPARW